MSLINVNHLTFAYEGSYDNIFEDVSFQIDTDWKLGFTGRNGRGKTTFLNLLMGRYRYQGHISAKVEFDYFPFPVANPSAMTISVVDEILPFYEYWQLSRELNYLEVSDEVLYRPFATLSEGEQTKVLLAALFLKEKHFLLIDEPTNHLDMHAREVVASYLQKKKGFILVSHDRWFLDQCIDHVLSINKNDIQIQKGNFSSWLYNKALQDQFEMAENEKLQRQIKSMEAAARRTARWSDTIEKRKVQGTGGDAGVKPDKGHIGAQAAKMMKRSKAAEHRKQNAIDEKSKLLKNIERADALKIHPLPYRTDVLVTFDKVTAWYENPETGSEFSLLQENASHTVPLFENQSFTIRQGDRIALHGPNGCGKSSMLKLIYNTAGGTLSKSSLLKAAKQCQPDVFPSFSGTIHTGSNLKISFVSQDTAWLSGTLEAFADMLGIDETLFKTILRKLDFDRMQFEKKIEDYSDGQKKKVLLAASLCQQAHLYIWDEPLNFIDVLSRMQIETLLLEYRPTMIFVEHDRTFCDNIATEIIEL